MAHLITESIHENVLEAEAAFTRAVTNLNEQQPLVSFHSLDTLKILFPLVEEVFFLESSGRIRFPVAKLLFAPDGSTNLEPNQARSSRFLKIMQEAQRYEFQQNAIQEALAIYQKALAQFSTRQLKGELLNAIARAQKKLTLFPDAISSYQQLAQDYSQVRITNGMPLGVP
jgi:tetratricopeptide (TPR) repeat protein